MRGLGALALLAGAAITPPAGAQSLDIGKARTIRTQADPVKITALAIVRNPDGSFVSDIDGKARNFGFKPGSVHSIRGKGFGTRSNSSAVLLKSADGRFAATLAIVRWEDDLIVAQVPAGQSGFPSADQLTLMILTGPSNGGPRQFVIRGGRFEAEEAEVKLPLFASDQRALQDAGLRIKAWNRGREFFTAERDGAVTVTHYVDFPKDQRTQLCPGPGSDRINLTQLASSLRLRDGFRFSRIAMSHGPTNGHFTGRYGDAWQAVDGTLYYRIDWGVWRMRRDASFSLNKPFDVSNQPFGRHVVIPDADKVFTACGSEFSLTFYVAGPRGLSPR